MREAVAAGGIALSYDDGPDPIWTGPILDLLASRGATGTFFVEGPAALRSPELVEEAAGRGHEVGLHCFAHRRHSTMTAAEIRADAEAALEALATIGVTPRAWRTPWGDESEATVAIAAELGLELWAWSHDSHDWRGDSCEQMLEAVAGAGLGEGPVVLMHDGLGPGARREGCEQTLHLTEALLELAAEAGLRPTSLSGSPALGER
jgi:peptidoglycan/xylan/chitin deacetylase (PgdA/CDA1 family)